MRLCRAGAFHATNQRRDVSAHTTNGRLRSPMPDMTTSAVLQVEGLVKRFSTGDETIAERVALLEEHDRAVDDQVRNLRAQQHHLRDKIRWYRSLSAESG